MPSSKQRRRIGKARLLTSKVSLTTREATLSEPHNQQEQGVSMVRCTTYKLEHFQVRANASDVKYKKPDVI